MSQPPEPTPGSSFVARRTILATVAGFLAIGALFFPSAGWDDAYITFWSAHALSVMGQMVNVNGQLVEQSSSLGFVLIIAVVTKISGLDASIVGRLASIAFGAATIWVTFRLASQVPARGNLLAPILVGTCTYFIYWTFGGMEASLAAFSGALLVLLVSKSLDDGPSAAQLTQVGLVSLVYISARPESLFILAATLTGVAAALEIRRYRRLTAEPWEIPARRRLAALLLPCLGATAALVLFRFWYFGRFFPQPVSAKVHLQTGQIVLDGLSYLLRTIESDFVIVALLAGTAAAVLLLSSSRWRRPASVDMVSAAFVAATCGFIVMSGGDGMHGGRFFVPAIPVAFVLGVALLSRCLTSRALCVVCSLWVIVQLVGVAAFARRESNSDPLWAVASSEDSGIERRFHWFERANHDHYRYWPAVTALETLIDQGVGRQRPVTILSGQSGFVVYHLGKTHHGAIRYFDRFGLVTMDFVDCPVSARLPRTNWGLQLTVESYLGRIAAFQQCGIPPPDIIFDLFWERFPAELDQRLKGAGYVVRYQQDHDVASGSAIFPGHTRGRVYIAVRQDSATVDGATK